LRGTANPVPKGHAGSNPARASIKSLIHLFFYHHPQEDAHVTTFDYDHRVIGPELDYFHLQDDAAGSVFWHPRGAAVFAAVQDLVRRRIAEGYREVRSPQLYQHRMWERSGHLDHYAANIYDVGDMLLKPMNCPAHVEIFKAGNHSHRDLPLRLSEFGCCHRKEPSGALHGIMRLRQFVQDDAHIFCAEEHVEAEVSSFCALLMRVYRDFGFEDIEVGLSLRPDDRAGDDALWDRSEEMLRAGIRAAGLEAEEMPGEGAFYGPKLEFGLRDRQGRRWQCGTLQLDFVLPGRLGARYSAPEGHLVPVMIHRAILGSLERFIGILLEHHGGVLPEWLMPVAAVILPVEDAHVERAREVRRLLGSARVEVDASPHSVSDRVKRHVAHHIPWIIVIGDREVESGLIAVRRRGSRRIEPMAIGNVSFARPPDA
jgi:threonyl-tRNA synthetase